MTATKKYHSFEVHPIVGSPIIYKKIDPAVFFRRGFEARLTKVEPDALGYVSESVNKHLGIEQSDTVLVNCGVGQGKTTAIYSIIKEVYETNAYLIIVALPFKSLIEKYYSNALEFAGHSDVSSYSDFDELLEGLTLSDEAKQYRAFKNALPEKASKPIQIITVNGLLGNPGEAVQQAKLKREYFSQIRSYCKESGRKVVFIFDEIHETVHNFKEELIFNLRLWKDITHKSIILTATYTEAAFVAAMHIAYLSEPKIHIIESERAKVPSRRLANLHLYFTKEPYYASKIGEFAFIEEELLRSDKYESINILSYSERLADAIARETSWFENKNVNLATSKGDPFDPAALNIGTTFKTGVDIIEKHALLIILLPGLTNQPFSSYGIFSDGIPSIVQAVARLRNGGDIFIFMPYPAVLMERTIPKDFGFEFESPQSEEYYSPLDEYRLVEKKYITIRAELEDLIDQAKKEQESGALHPVPVFPSLDAFILEKSQSFLVNSEAAYGKLVYPYVIWAACNDQFTNCTLRKIWTHNTQTVQLELDHGNLRPQLLSFLAEYNGFEQFRSQMDNTDDFRNFMRLLDQLQFVNHKDGSRSKVQIVSKDSERNLFKLSRLQQELLGILYEYKFPDAEHPPMNKKFFFLMNCHAAKSKKGPLAEGYKAIAKLRREFLSKLAKQGSNIIYKQDSNNPDPFITEDVAKLFKQSLLKISDDYFIKNKVFSLSLGQDATKQQIYKVLVDLFLDRINETKRDLNGRPKHCTIVAPSQLPKKCLNLLGQE